MTGSKRVLGDFKQHPPSEEQEEKYIAIRAKAKELAILLDNVCPYSTESSIAINKLQEVVMWANSAIART